MHFIFVLKYYLEIMEKLMGVIIMRLIKQFWKRTFDYKGVISRRDFFLTIAVNIIIFILINLTALLLAGGDAGNEGLLLTLGRMVAYVGAAYIILQIFPMLSLVIRRLHDLNGKWWYILLGVNPIGLVALIVLLCLGTVKENNKWREDDIRRGYLLQ